MKISRLAIFVCLCVLALTGLAVAQSADEVDARRAQLQRELEAEERAIAEQTLLLQAKQRDTATVSGEIDLLKSQIAKAQASIKAKKVAIERLQSDITARTTKIKTLDNKIAEQKESLAELLRQVRDVQQLSLPEVVLEDKPVTEIFRDIDHADSIESALAVAIAAMRQSQDQAREEQKALEQKKNAEFDAQQQIEIERKQIERKEAERQVALAINRTQEKSYQQVIAVRQQKAAQIRAALFALRDTAAIPFGKALEFANLAYKKTGVRPAFLLAILQQESNLGANVGSCFVTDLTTGNGAGKNTGTLFEQVLKAPRDTVPFMNITSQLGLDWRTVPVSCPIDVEGRGSATKYYVGRGFGGGMGPAQFIPSTWDLFKDRIAQMVGKRVANPWEPEDAFMASAIYLADLGAGDSGTPTAERTAACRYYSGQNCYKANGAPAVGLTYGTQVLARAINIQVNMIDPLQNN